MLREIAYMSKRGNISQKGEEKQPQNDIDCCKIICMSQDTFEYIYCNAYFFMFTFSMPLDPEILSVSNNMKQYKRNILIASVKMTKNTIEIPTFKKYQFVQNKGFQNILDHQKREGQDHLKEKCILLSEAIKDETCFLAHGPLT